MSRGRIGQSFPVTVAPSPDRDCLQQPNRPRDHALSAAKGPAGSCRSDTRNAIASPLGGNPAFSHCSTLDAMTKARHTRCAR